MIITQLLRPSMKDGKAPPIGEFMLKHSDDRKREGAHDFLTKLDMLARSQARDERRKAKAAALPPKLPRPRRNG